jgi:hypothetical protein
MKSTVNSYVNFRLPSTVEFHIVKFPFSLFRISKLKWNEMIIQLGIVFNADFVNFLLLFAYFVCVVQCFIFVSSSWLLFYLFPFLYCSFCAGVYLAAVFWEKWSLIILKLCFSNDDNLSIYSNDIIFNYFLFKYIIVCDITS